MPIQSYLVYPRNGERGELISSLKNTPFCEILESNNKDIIILVTDTEDDYQEGMLQENLKLIPQIQGMALVYAQEN